MYSAYKLNKQEDNMQLGHTPFPDLEPVLCPMSGSNCWFLTCIGVSQEAGKVVWYSHLMKILQARLEQYMNQKRPDVQAGFRKGRGTRDQIANIH